MFIYNSDRFIDWPFSEIRPFFDGCAALSTLSIRSFIQDLTSSSIFFSVRISFFMLLNSSASKETGLSGKFERKVI